MNSRQKQHYTEELAFTDHPSGLTPFEIAFCLYYVQGCTQRQALELAADGTDRLDGLTVRQQSVIAHKMAKRPEVRDYLRALLAKLEEMAVASALEIQMFLTDVIRTPPSQVNSNHHLCQRVNRRVMQTPDGPVSFEDPEMVNKMDAVKTLIAMKGLSAPVKVDINHNVGVMVVPMATNVDDWQSQAQDSQAKLMTDAADI